MEQKPSYEANSCSDG